MHFTNSCTIIRMHRVHAMHRCSLLVQMLHVVWSVCYSVTVGHTGELCKMAVPIGMVVTDYCGSKEPCIRRGFQIPHGKGHL